MADEVEKILDPRLDPAQMTLEDAAARLGNDVYAAIALFERLEGAGLVNGNGHHMRQEAARYATDLLRRCWSGPVGEN